MRVVEARNVHEAWARLPGVLADAEEQESRAGPVLVCPEPVTTVYLRPTERVLRDERRDCNPFFHVVEALWMLTGRRDAATLDRYVRDFGKRFGDGPEDARFIHGAYGERWRGALGFDQLNAVVEKLKADRRSRQAVIQMWDASVFSEGSDDLTGTFNDRPCNTHIYLRVQDKPEIAYITDHPADATPTAYNRRLDLTVCCRSNDMVFGGYGANAVHFSVLQEYLAARIGIGVGTLTQISNNYHVYKDVWDRVRPTGEAVYENEEWGPAWLNCAPMFDKSTHIDEDLRTFMGWHDELLRTKSIVPTPHFHNSWFNTTAVPLVRAHDLYHWKLADAALSAARGIGCLAWRAACMEWLERRGAK